MINKVDMKQKISRKQSIVIDMYERFLRITLDSLELRKKGRIPCFYEEFCEKSCKSQLGIVVSKYVDLVICKIQNDSAGITIIKVEIC